MISLDLPGAARETGLSVDTLKRAIVRGDLKAKRSGTTLDPDGKTIPTGKYLVTHKALEAYIEALMDA